MADAVKVLIVDDEPRICEFLEILLKREGYSPRSVNKAADALATVEGATFDLVLTDLRMPGMDGFELVTRLKATRPELPVIMITGYATVETAVQALRYGVDDYVTKPFNIDELRKVISRTLQSARLERENHALMERLQQANAEMERHRRLLADKVRKAGSELEAARESLDRHRETVEILSQAMQERCLSVIGALAGSLEAKDRYSNGHSRRVTEYACALARAVGASPQEVELLQRAAQLHDIGMVTLSGQILDKPQALNDEERAQVQRHPETGESIIKPLDFLAEARPMIRHHHERVDGQGYPDRLRGDEIPLLTRMLTIADAFDAMTSERPYRPALSTDRAAAELRSNAGSQFDPRLTEEFCARVIPRP